MLDALPKVAIALVMFLVVSYIGIGIAAETGTSGALAPIATSLENGSAGWIVMLVMAIGGGLAIAAAAGSAFAPLNYDSPPARTQSRNNLEWHGSPVCSRPEPTRLYWDPYQNRTSPVPVTRAPDARSAPAQVRGEPTEEERIAHDPEIVAITTEIADIDKEISTIDKKQEKSDGWKSLVEQRW